MSPVDPTDDPHRLDSFSELDKIIAEYIRASPSFGMNDS